MNTWLRRVRGALGMGLAWGVTGFVAGGVVELIHNIWPNPVGGAVDIWPAVLAYPGFFGGICFSAVMGIAARHRRFDELSAPRVALWGALGGVLTSQIPTAMVLVGLATPSVPLWQIALSLAIPFAAGGATAAAGTLWLARRGDEVERGRVDADLAGIGLSEAESRQLLGPHS